MSGFKSALSCAEIEEYMKAEVALTVSESKRLIAKGVVAMDCIQEKLAKGIIVLNTGTTNGCIYEELTGQTIDRRAFVTGRTTPAKWAQPWKVARLPDLVLVDGQPAPELDRFTALEKMQAGDIYIKGANALNYGARIAGITIGHPEGGTIGRAIGPIIGRKMRLIIPVGLEKEVPFDIQEASALISEPDEHLGVVHSLWPIAGTIVTEIEALETLCGVEAVPIPAGAVAGAEGAVRRLLLGEADYVRQAVELVESIHGEPAFG